MKRLKFVLIIHEVEDYEAWKVIFDQSSSMRKDAGENSYQVMSFIDQPNNIVHLSVWSSHQNAKVFFESEEVIKIREKAKVKKPQFIYLEQLEKGILKDFNI